MNPASVGKATRPQQTQAGRQDNMTQQMQAGQCDPGMREQNDFTQGIPIMAAWPQQAWAERPDFARKRAQSEGKTKCMSRQRMNFKVPLRVRGSSSYYFFVSEMFGSEMFGSEVPGSEIQIPGSEISGSEMPAVACAFG